MNESTEIIIVFNLDKYKYFMPLKGSLFGVSRVA